MVRYGGERLRESSGVGLLAGGGTRGEGSCCISLHGWFIIPIGGSTSRQREDYCRSFALCLCAVRGREGRRKSDGLAHRQSHVISALCVLFPTGYSRQIPDFVCVLVLLRQFLSFVPCLTLSFYSPFAVLLYIWRDLSSFPLFADELKRFVRRSFCSFPSRLRVLMGLCVRVCALVQVRAMDEDTREYCPSKITGENNTEKKKKNEKAMMHSCQMPRATG